ncbi:MAG TPA: Ig-like domain-containing protein [Gemmatimonadaceae bacterium]|jgi:hypothetical protein|nr:Ig-like domain-containing protein [Gemmatimonadaceae bacterium]
MRTIRRAHGFAAALLFSIAGTSCRESNAPSGPGRIAPAGAALAFSSVLPESSGELVIPLRAARVRLFRLPGEVPERAVLDTLVPFRETDPDLSLTIGIATTMVSERFGLELSLIDDQQQVAFRARDTVVSYTAGQAPPIRPVLLRYVGADTAVARIVLATDAPVIEVGQPASLRASAFLRDGRSTSARFGYAVHGTSAITVDAEGVVRAAAAVPPGVGWVVARIATGLADSIRVEAIVPAASISLSATSGHVDVGASFTLDAVTRDASGAPLARTPTWSSSDERVATVADGVVTGRARGSALIIARSGRASAEATITVGPPKVTHVEIAPRGLSLVQGEVVDLAATAFDATGAAQSGRVVAWSIIDPSVASVDDAGTVRALNGGRTSIIAMVDDVADTISVLTREPTTLAITRTATTVDDRGEIAAFLVSSFDQLGAPLDHPDAQWSVTPGATLLNARGPRTELVLREHAQVVLSAQAYGLRADLPVATAVAAAPTARFPLRPPERW